MPRFFFAFHRITFFFLLFIFVMLSVDWHHPFSRRIMDLFGDNGPSIFFIISLRCYKMLQYYSHPYYFPSFLVNLVQLIVSPSHIIPLVRICEKVEIILVKIFLDFQFLSYSFFNAYLSLTA